MGDIAGKRRLLDLLHKKRTKQCEDSLYEFLKDGFKAIHNDQPLQPNFHLKYISDRLQKKIEDQIAGKPQKGIIINVPPRSLKSEMIICMTVWAWIKEPSTKFISSSYSAILSIKHNVIARRLIESQWYQERWGDKVQLTSDQNAKGEFENTASGFRAATSTGGSATGKGADIVIIDDALNPEQSASDVEREKSIRFFKDTLSSRLDDPNTGFFMIIAHRLHEMDLAGTLLDEEPEEWDHICIPAEVNDHVSPPGLKKEYIDGLFFPNRFTVKYLKRMSKRMTSTGYSCQYDQLAAPEAGNIILKEWFDIITQQDFIQTSPMYFRADTAFTEKTENDPCAILAWCFMHRDAVIVNAFTERMKFPRFCKFLAEYVELHGYTDESLIKIEPKANGISVVDQVRETTSLNIMKGKAPKDSKTTRVHAITPTLQAGRVKLLKGPWNKPFLHQAGMFPNSKNDDMVDCLAEAVRDFNRQFVGEYL